MASKRPTGSSGSKEQKQKDKKKKAAKDISVIEENFMQEDEGMCIYFDAIDFNTSISNRVFEMYMVCIFLLR